MRAPEPSDFPDPWVAAWTGDIVRVLAGLALVLDAGRLTEPVIHKSRRELKRLRSLLRLAPPALEPAARETRAETGDLRRWLGGARDAAVMGETLAKLAPDLGEAAARIGAVLSEHHRAVAGDLDRAPRRSQREAIERLRDHWSTLAVDDLGAADLCAAAAKRYRRGRKRSAAPDDDAKGLHEWRKAAVDHQYHLSFFAAAFAAHLEHRRAELKRLRKALGEINDLRVLLDFVRGHQAIAAEDFIRLERAANAARKVLLNKARHIGEPLFEEGPCKLRRRLERHVARFARRG